MTDSIRACARCRFAVKFIPAGQIQSQLQCRWGPPVMVVLPARAQPGQISVQITPFVRAVPDAYWCHQFGQLAEGESVPIESGNVQNAAVQPS